MVSITHVAVSKDIQDGLPYTDANGIIPDQKSTPTGRIRHFRKARSSQLICQHREVHDKLKYFTSFSYNNTEGILVSNGIEKVSARLNIDNKVSKLIDLGFSLNLNRNKIDQVSADNAFSSPMQLVALSPITPPRDLRMVFI